MNSVYQEDAPYPARKRRPVGVEKREGGLLFTYSDGTTSFHPNPRPLMTFVAEDGKLIEWPK
jgi:hypothetical protein